MATNRNVNDVQLAKACREALEKEYGFKVPVPKCVKRAVLKTLKREQKGKPDRKTTQAISKIEKEKRLSSEEFLKIHDTLWKKGPPVKYQNPDSW